MRKMCETVSDQCIVSIWNQQNSRRDCWGSIQRFYGISRVWRSHIFRWRMSSSGTKCKENSRDPEAERNTYLYRYRFKCSMGHNRRDTAIYGSFFSRCQSWYWRHAQKIYWCNEQNDKREFEKIITGSRYLDSHSNGTSCKWYRRRA